MDNRSPYAVITQRLSNALTQQLLGTVWTFRAIRWWHALPTQRRILFTQRRLSIAGW